MPVCDDIISHARKANADECEAVACSKKIITVRITDSEIAEFKENQERIIGVRLIQDKRISSFQSTSLEPSRMIDEALRFTSHVGKKEFWRGLPENKDVKTDLQKTNDVNLWDIDSSRAVDVAYEMINSASHPCVNRISGSLNIVCEEFEIQNTSGLSRQDRATYIAGVINADSEGGDAAVSGIGQASSRTLASFDAQMIGSDAAQMCADSQNPKKCERESTSIIFDPLAVGELLSFVFTPNFGLKTYSEKKSCFSDKLGCPIATPIFNLLDDPHKPDSLGAKSFDDEGVPTMVSHYIRNGVFENTFSDSYNAYKEGANSSANAVRAGSPLGRSASPIPVASPHNLTIKAGDSKREDIIRDTKKGIMISRLWYTYAVNPIKGDFSCTARSGIWIILDGQIVSPAKPVRIIHSLPALLQKTTAVGTNQRDALSWAAMPVSTPTIRCEDIPIVPI